MTGSNRALMNGNVVTNGQINYLIKVDFKKMQREDRKLSVLLNNVQCWKILGRVSISSCGRRAKYGDVREWKCFLVCSACKQIYEGWNFNSDNYLFTTDTK